jgi:type II secretory pathway component PulJ
MNFTTPNDVPGSRSRVRGRLLAGLITMFHRERRLVGGNEEGTLLLEVLLAVGLLGVVTTCTLAILQQSRRMERRVSETLREIAASDRMAEYLQADLLNASEVRPEGVGSLRSSSLVLTVPMPKEGASARTEEHLIAYRWQERDSQLVRSDEVRWRVPVPVTVGPPAPVEFELHPWSDDQQTPATGAAGVGLNAMAPDSREPIKIRAVSYRMLTVGTTPLEDASEGGPSAAGQAVFVYLPVPLPAVTGRDPSP